MKTLIHDFRNNRTNVKGLLVLLSFRIVNLASKNKFIFYLFIPLLIFYRIVVEWFLGIEIPYNVNLGPGAIIYHGQSLVINSNVIIGKNCILRHCTTIGNKKMLDGSYSSSPIIGDNVDIGSNVCIIGPITIGDNVVIGAGTVVVKNVPSNSTVVGNPSKNFCQN